MWNFLKKKEVLVIAAFLTGVVITFLGVHFFGSNSLQNSTCTSQYKFVNPQPDCDTFVSKVSKVQATQDEIQVQVLSFIQSGQASRIGVWSRDLVSLKWIGVNELDTYPPASLLKIPVMIAYYKYSEIDPNILALKLKNTDKTDQNAREEYESEYLKKYPLQFGQSYTVEELIERMIKYSDNNAFNILAQNMNDSFMRKVLLDLGISIPSNAGPDQDFVSARTYGGIFRTLYNSTYLNRDNSEKALSLLSQSDFTAGVRSITPTHVPVAEKFGERTSSDGNEKILNECGIVYPDFGPYTFCIFVQGSDSNNLKTIIQSISKTLYSGLSQDQKS